MKNLSYNELVEQIKNAPMTWLPGLLVTAARAAVAKNVFLRGSMARFVQKIEDETGAAEQPQPIKDLALSIHSVGCPARDGKPVCTCGHLRRYS